MANDLVFVSYSRKEFYFTESLVLHLQRAGIDAWFDVQQLEPGIGWKTDIQDGLERCKALVLVASQSSLASPYVKAEVEAVQKAGKPVYVVLFEPIALPPEISHPTAVIDFMQGFDRGMSLLTTVIRENSTHTDPIPNGQALFLPEGVTALTRLLRKREMLWFALLIGFLIALVRPIIYFLSDEYRSDPGYAAAMAFVPFSLIWVLIGLIMYRHVFRMAAKVERRESIPFRLWVKAIDFRIDAWGSIIVLIVTYVIAFRSFIFVLLVFPLLYIGIRFVLTETYKKRIQVLLNPDVLRWCHLGNDAPFDWRLMVNQAALPEDMEVEIASKMVTHEDSEGNKTTSEVVTGVFLSVKGAKLTPKTYRLYSTPQIQAVADDIRLILRKNVFQELKDSGAEPDFHILLLSPWTPVELAQNLITEHPQNTLPVMVAPADLSLLPTVTTLQLIDFRKRYEPVLASALQYLHTENDQQRSVFSIGVLPIRVSEVFPLRELRSLSRYIICLASLCILMGLLGVFSLFTRFSVDASFILSLVAYIACFGFAFQFRKIVIDIRNLKPGLGTRLLRLTIAAVVLLAGMFMFELQPRIGTQGSPVSDMGRDLGWHLAGSAFFVTIGIVVCIEIIRAMRYGRLLSQPQPILGIPPTPPPPTFVFFQYSVCLFVGVALMYFVVTGIEGDAAGKLTSYSPLSMYGSTFLFVMIAGIVSAFITLGIAASPVLSNDDPVFAIGDAPALRHYLRSSLRQSTAPAFSPTSNG